MPHFEPCPQCGKAVDCTCIVGGGKTTGHPTSSPVLTSKKQVGGDHYLVLPIQPWTIIDANRLNFYEGCALKYLLRKKGNRVEDLEKAIHYLEHEVEFLKGVRPKECLQCGGLSNEKDILYYGCCAKCALEPIGPSPRDIFEKQQFELEQNKRVYEELKQKLEEREKQQEEPNWDEGFWLCAKCGIRNKNCWGKCRNCQNLRPFAYTPKRG